MGIFDFLKSNNKKPSVNLNDFKFISDNHIRTQNGITSNTNNKGAWRGIRIQTSDNIVYTVTMYNLNGNHPVWEDNIQMSPKTMKILQDNRDEINLRGFGRDSMGGSFADYGITLHKEDSNVKSITLHMYDRNIQIKYLKGELKDIKEPQKEKVNYSSIFENAFGRPKKPNEKKRTFSNLEKGLSTGYILFFQQATNEYLSGNYNTSLQLINKTIQLSDINDWKHYAFKANVLEDLQKYDDAISNYEQAIEFSENDINVYALYHQIGFCYLSIGNNKKAAEFYTYSLELKKQHPNNQFNEDLEGMDGGVLLGVPFKRIYNNRGNALKNLNKLNEAIEDCKKALSYDKQYSNTYLLLSQIYSLAGQENKAIEMLRQSAILGNQNAIRMLQQMGK